MKKITFICDRCKKEQVLNSDERGSFSYDNVKIKTVRLFKDESGEVTRTELCEKCRNWLYGEIGALKNKGGEKK